MTANINLLLKICLFLSSSNKLASPLNAYKNNMFHFVTSCPILHLHTLLSSNSTSKTKKYKNKNKNHTNIKITNFFQLKNETRTQKHLTILIVRNGSEINFYFCIIMILDLRLLTLI